MDHQSFATRTLIAVLLLNAALLAITYALATEALQDDLALFIGAGLVLSLGLWFAIYQIGKGLAGAAPAREEPVERAPEAPAQPSPTPAIQVLSLFQRKGRLIDFLQEDLQHYDDAQIGAAVRNVHEGCKAVLAEYVQIEPIFEEPEGSEVTVQSGFDAREIRLTGNVTGDPPFRGALRHRGWRVKDVDLPALMQASDQDRVLAAAEVEVQTSGGSS